jgi:hypothetical protein
MRGEGGQQYKVDLVHYKQSNSTQDRPVDVLVATGGIPSWTTFLREEEDSKKSKEDHLTVEEHPGREDGPQEKIK